VHIVDGSAGLWWGAAEQIEDGSAHPAQTTDPIADFKRINAELEQYDPVLAAKPQIVAINKIDLQEVRDRLPTLIEQFHELGYDDVYPISAATGQGVQELMRAVAARLRELPRPAWEEEPAPEEEEVVVKPRHTAAESARFEIARESKHHLRVIGDRVERMVVMTDMNNPFALERMQREFERLKVSQALRDAGVETGDTVSIGRVDLEWSNDAWAGFAQSTRRKRHTGPGKRKS
jgi:GTP-binding protein